MIPYNKLVKLAVTFGKIAKKHGGKVLHAADNDGLLLAKDLGDALRRQMKIIQDPDISIIETVSQVLPVVAEVKVLTFAVAKKMDISTENKGTIDVLASIIATAKSADSDAADEIEKTLDWTRAFFSQPKIQEILEEKITTPRGPKSLIDVPGMARGVFGGVKKIGNEIYTLYRFLDEAKKPPQPPKTSKAPKGRKPKT